VTIHEQQPVTTSSPQREQVTEENRAVAAEDERKLPAVDDRVN
jgi:hypothetical protein